MKAIITESGLTDRIKRIQLAADTFEEERLLKLLIDGLATGKVLFEPSRDGVPSGTIFGNCRRVEDGEEGPEESEEQDG